MAFADAGSYARFMGRFSEPLAPSFADLVRVRTDDLATRTPEQVAELEELLRSRMPDEPFELTAWTWTATGGSPSSR